MTSETQLPGFDDLLETCRRLDVPVELDAPATVPLTQGEIPKARPIDPYLSALYARVGGMLVGRSVGDFQLYRRDESINALKSINKDEVSDFKEPFGSVVAFAGHPATLYFFALVPWLASARGIQPVVLIDPYEEIHALPVASDLNEFFKTYARCLEFVVANPWAAATDVPDINFWGLPEMLSADQRLVEMVSSGRFSALMRQDAEARDWIRKMTGGGAI